MNYYDLEISFGKRNIIGYVGENEVVRVIFNVKEWEDKFGLADSFVLTVQTSENYPVPVTYENGKVYWVVGNDTLAQKGYGALQLSMLKGEQVKKSAIAEIIIKNSLETGAEPPEHYQSWVEDMTEQVASIPTQISNALKGITWADLEA